MKTSAENKLLTRYQLDLLKATKTEKKYIQIFVDQRQPYLDEQKQFLKDQINSSEKNIVKNTIGKIIEGIK